MKISESVKKGWGVAVGSFPLLLALFVFGAVWNVINVSMTPQLQTPQAQISMMVLVAGILFILASIFVQAGTLGYVRDKVKQGNATLSVFFSSGSKYYIRLLLLGLFIAVVVGSFVLLAALSAALLAGQFSVVGIVVAVVFAAIGIYLAILMFMAPYYIVTGDQKVLAAVKQSVALVRKNLLRLLGITLILALIGFGAGAILGVLFALLSAAVTGNTAQYIFAVLSSFVNAFLGLLVTGSFMAFYLGTSNNTSGAA